jgi:uncharacterized repeat protein (TIGR03803 family)
MTEVRVFRMLTARYAAVISTVVRLLAISCGLIVLTSSAAHAQTFSVVHAFTEPNGVVPAAGVTIKAGVLYGTTACTQYCTGNGTVYQIIPVGSNWYFTPISLLSAGGGFPQARVVFGPDNHLYGSTFVGGPQNFGLLFNLTPRPTICATANCFWVQKLLYAFTGSPDGANPGGGDLVWDPMGNIYGTTVNGGPESFGTVYQVMKAGNDWTELPIYSFTGPNGAYPYAGVILDGNGDVFGTTLEGGLYGYGTVFELTYVNGIGWKETLLYNFQNLSDGQSPYAGMVRDTAGNLYGATSDGGSGGGGTVFQMSPTGNGWTFTLLYSLSGQQGNYCGPRASLSIDNSGSLYGTTMCDGANSLGSVFRLTNTQSGWEYTSLHDFTGGLDGAEPISNVAFDTSGILYGTAATGGNSSCNPPYGCGTVWMIKP